MVRKLPCPRCCKPIVVQFDEEGQLYRHCSNCGVSAVYPDQDSHSWDYEPYLDFPDYCDSLTGNEQYTVEQRGHSALTYRQRCGQRHTDGG